MAQLSTYGANAVLNGTAIPATLYLKLHVSAPGAAGTSGAATETTRKSFTRTTSTAAANSNVADMTWTSVAGTEDFTYATAWDASTAGNCWFTDIPVTANAVTTGDTFTIAAGDLDFTAA